MKITRALAALCAVLATVVLAACGDDEQSTATAGGTASGPVAVTDDLGRRVELEAPAKRVVTLEWDATENALALGVTPVGAGDVEVYRDWVAAGRPIPEQTAPVGTRTEPSLEKVAALKPDLIIAGRQGATKNRAKLERIAPVVVFDGFVDPNEGGSELERVERQFKATAKLLGKEEQAERVLAGVDAKIAEAKRRIADAGRAGDEIALAQGFTDGKPTARLFDDRSLMVEVARRAGLENAFDGEAQEWGITPASLEGLRKIGDADWLLTMAVPEDDPFKGAWAKNPAYQRLPVVEAGHVRHLGGDTWTWGGPLSVALAAERYADAVTGEA